MRGTATLFVRSEGAGDKLCRDEALTGEVLLFPFRTRDLCICVPSCMKGTSGEEVRG